MFLALNDVRLEVDELELYRLTIAIAEREGPGRATKEDVAAFLRSHLPNVG